VSCVSIIYLQPPSMTSFHTASRASVPLIDQFAKRTFRSRLALCSQARCRFSDCTTRSRGTRGHWLLRVRLIASSERELRYWWPTSMVYYLPRSKAAIRFFLGESIKNDGFPGRARIMQFSYVWRVSFLQTDGAIEHGILTPEIWTMGTQRFWDMRDSR